MSGQSSRAVQQNNIEEQPLIDVKYKLLVHVMCFVVIALSLINLLNSFEKIINILNPKMAGKDKDKSFWPHIFTILSNSTYICGATLGLIALKKEKMIYFYICITSSISRSLSSIIQIIYLCVQREQFSMKSLINPLIGGLLVSLTIITGIFILIKQFRAVRDWLEIKSRINERLLRIRAGAA